MKNRENNNEKWWKIEKQQWKMMKTRGTNNETWWKREKKTRNHDEQIEKNNEKWWKRDEKQWKMMNNREAIMKNDEK